MCIDFMQRELALRWNDAAGDDGEADEQQERIPEVRISDSFVCVASFLYVTGVVRMCDMTHSYV